MLTFSSAEHIIFISDSVSTVPACVVTSTMAVLSLRPTREMRLSGTEARREGGREGGGGGTKGGEGRKEEERERDM